MNSAASSVTVMSTRSPIPSHAHQCCAPKSPSTLYATLEKHHAPLAISSIVNAASVCVCVCVCVWVSMCAIYSLQMEFGQGRGSNYLAVSSIPLVDEA